MTPVTGQVAVDALIRLLDLERLAPDDQAELAAPDPRAGQSAADPRAGQSAPDPRAGQSAPDPRADADASAAVFRGASPAGGPQRVFGGQVAAQALVAAGRTVDEARHVHSLHGYFLRAGEPGVPILYRVERVRDGRSFSVRRSVAYQHDKPIFFMSASFHVAEEGLDHHAPAPVDVPPPQELPTMFERLERYPERLGIWSALPRPIDVRYVGEPGWVRPGDRPADVHQRVWMRIDGKLPDDGLLHACALAFCSDLTLLDSVLSVHGEVWGPGGVVGASLDHALWFHRPFRADEWFLYDCWSPSAAGARGLATGRMFDRDGRHIATAVQEGLLRRVGA